jgi:uncharacterized protein (DUF433 family)
MQLEDYFEFVEPNHIRIKGHCIGIESILSKYLAGQTAEEIARQYDTLRLLDIYATITYYLQNREAVDAYLAHIERLTAEDMARGDANPPPNALRLREKETASGVAVFTPDNEPYLGRESVYHFDRVLVTFIAHRRRISAWTHKASLTLVQRAASELVPGASSVALSIRELVRQGYLLSALILTRPLMERVATLIYLIENPSAVTLWQQGWPHKTRPKLPTLMEAMRGADELDDSRMRRVRNRYNGLVHGDPDAALHGAVLLADGSAGYTISKDLGSPQRADEICIETTAWLIVLLARCSQVFP